jgi:hypothetical protein
LASVTARGCTSLLGGHVAKPLSASSCLLVKAERLPDKHRFPLARPQRCRAPEDTNPPRSAAGQNTASSAPAAHTQLHLCGIQFCTYVADKFGIQPMLHASRTPQLSNAVPGINIE